MVSITMKFNLDGTCEIQDEPGQNAERNLRWLYESFGVVTFHGHGIGHKHEEGVHIHEVYPMG